MKKKNIIIIGMLSFVLSLAFCQEQKVFAAQGDVVINKTKKEDCYLL